MTMKPSMRPRRPMRARSLRTTHVSDRQGHLYHLGPHDHLELLHGPSAPRLGAWLSLASEHPEHQPTQPPWLSGLLGRPGLRLVLTGQRPTESPTGAAVARVADVLGDRRELLLRFARSLPRAAHSA